MSFIDTIALPLFVAFVGIIALVFVASWAFSTISDARWRARAAKRDVRLERQAYEFIEAVYVEVNSGVTPLELPQALNEQLWVLHDQIDSKKELHR